MVSFLKINICITRKEYIGLVGLTPYEAMNELNDFISQGLLRRRGRAGLWYMLRGKSEGRIII